MTEVALGEHDALIVIDVQVGFDDPAWGARNNPACEENIAALMRVWRRARRLVVFVRHDSRVAGSPLVPGTPGNRFKAQLEGEPDLLVEKFVHSAFYGQPDLDGWLQQNGVDGVVIAGIATDHCCESTARMAADLGYRVLFAIDATHTFDRRLPSGDTVAADDVMRVSAASLHDEFCQVVTTAGLVEASAQLGRA